MIFNEDQLICIQPLTFLYQFSKFDAVFTEALKGIVVLHKGTSALVKSALTIWSEIGTALSNSIY